MLVGTVAALRELRREDVSALHAVFGSDPHEWTLMNPEPWQPWTPEQAQARYDRLAGERDRASVPFAVQSATDGAGRCLGSASVWGIDDHNRTAHLGIGLLPAGRGRGIGTDAVRLLCRYAFEVRDLARVSIETLATNTAMLATAERAGFVREGVLRGSAYVAGQRVDEVVLGLLREEWA